MPFSLNKAIIIGRIGRDCEVRETTSNVRVATFSVATDYGVKKGDSWENKTTWHNIVVYNPTDFEIDYLKKGKLIGIEGRINTRDYVDKDNVKRYITEIIADKLIILEKKDNVEQNFENYNYDGIDNSSTINETKKKQNFIDADNSSKKNMPNENSSEDDLPF
jgi:single-strand DNA-binding protein